MKTHVLAAVIALFAGAALAQTPAEKAPATPGSNTANAAGSTTSATGSTSEDKATTKKASKKKAASKKKSTQSMGAGPAAPETDLSASARQARIEAAYATWQSKR
jgi:hypothetical protein